MDGDVGIGEEISLQPQGKSTIINTLSIGKKGREIQVNEQFNNT